MSKSLGKSALRICAALAAVLTAPHPAAAETLADALAKAYAFHPRLASSRAALRAADEGVTQERARALGEIDGTYSYTVSNSSGFRRIVGSRRDSSDRDTFDTLSLGISGAIPIYSGGQIENAIAGAQENVGAQRASLLAVEQEVLLAAVTAYEDVRRDLQRVALARNNVRVISEQLRAARDRFEVGEVTRTDVSQAEARLAFSRSNLAAATGTLARSRQAYVAAIGEEPVDLAPPPPLPDLPDSLEAALALTEAAHPRLVAARRAVRQAQFAVKQALGAALPTLNVTGGVSYENDLTTGTSTTGETLSAQVGLSGQVPLWTGGRNPSLVRAAQARLAQAQAELHDVARQLRQQTSVAWANLDVARASIRAAREQIEAARIAFEGVREEATLGARTTLDVLNAEQELNSARVSLVESLRDEYVAAYQLLAAVGRLTVAHLGLDVSPYDPDAYVEQVRAAPYDYPRDDSVAWSSPWRP